MAQNGSCLAGIVVAIMIKEDDFPADLSLQAFSSLDFCYKKSLGKKAGRLLTEAYNWGAHLLPLVLIIAFTHLFRFVNKELEKQAKDNTDCATNQWKPQIRKIVQRE